MRAFGAILKALFQEALHLVTVATLLQGRNYLSAVAFKHGFSRDMFHVCR